MIGEHIFNMVAFFQRLLQENQFPWTHFLGGNFRHQALNIAHFFEVLRYFFTAGSIVEIGLYLAMACLNMLLWI